MRRKPVCVISIWLLLSLADASATAQRPVPKESPARGRILAIRITGRETKQPIAGVTITAEGPDSEEFDTTAVSDERGLCEVLVPEKALETNRFSILGFKSGFLPIRVHWGFSEEADPIPKEYALILDPAVRIGGTVLDEEGKPVAGACIFPSIHSRRSRKESIATVRGFFAESNQFGKWHCELLPVTWTSGQVWFRVEHPQFVSSGSGFDRILAIRDLRAERAVLK